MWTEIKLGKFDWQSGYVIDRIRAIDRKKLGKWLCD